MNAFTNIKNLIFRQKDLDQNQDIELPQQQNSLQESSINSINSLDLKQREYTFKQIDQTNRLYFTSQISNNEQYLAYGGYDELLKIYDIEMKKIVKKVKVNSHVWKCKFTQDSSQILTGSTNIHNGQAVIQGYDVLKQFKKKFQMHLFGQYLQCVITCGSDGTIIKTDIKSKKQLFKLHAHDSLTSSIDLCYLKDLLISGSYDSSIKLWDCQNRSLIINKQQSHSCFIVQVQFINNKQFLLSLDKQHNLYKWKIDQIKKELFKMSEIKDPNNIYSFQYFNQSQILLLICENYFKLVDGQGEVLVQQNHQAGEFCKGQFLMNVNNQRIQDIFQSDLNIKSCQQQPRFEEYISKYKIKIQLYILNLILLFSFHRYKTIQKPLLIKVYSEIKCKFSLFYSFFQYRSQHSTIFFFTQTKNLVLDAIDKYIVIDEKKIITFLQLVHIKDAHNLSFITTNFDQFILFFLITRLILNQRIQLSITLQDFMNK